MSILIRAQAIAWVAIVVGSPAWALSLDCVSDRNKKIAAELSLGDNLDSVLRRLEGLKAPYSLISKDNLLISVEKLRATGYKILGPVGLGTGDMLPTKSPVRTMEVLTLSFDEAEKLVEADCKKHHGWTVE
jgi:hypothetical protein